MNSKTWLKSGLVFALLVISGTYLFLTRDDPAMKIGLSERPSIPAGVPVGEIVQGFRAEQRINAKLAHRRTHLEDEGVCVELLMANYSNRANTGLFAVDLLLDGKAFVQQIDAVDIRDNTNHRICYEDVSVAALIEARDIRLVLRGISSPPGAAVTAWTTSDLSAGQLVGVPERLASRSLVFHFSTQAVSEQARNNALVLIVLGALAAATAFLPSPRAAPAHSVGQPTQEPK